VPPRPPLVGHSAQVPAQRRQAQRAPRAAHGQARCQPPATPARRLSSGHALAATAAPPALPQAWGMGGFCSRNWGFLPQISTSEAAAELGKGPALASPQPPRRWP